MKTAYLDCFSGISGDMFLGALLDAGLPFTALDQVIRTLPFSGFTITTAREKRMGLTGTKFTVEVEYEKQGHRGLDEIIKIISEGELSNSVKERSIRVFESLAEEEGKIHGLPHDRVHFHEIGAVDSIIDIVGTIFGMEYMKISSVFCSSLPLGSGFIESSHGRIPLPAPATIALLKDIPVYQSGLGFELVTPTGAALVKELVSIFNFMPSMTVENTGYGVGGRELPDRPNLFRIIIGNEQRTAETETVLIMEANLDDHNPECSGYLMERLFKAGALDVIFIPVQMKKNRPGILVQVIGKTHDLDKLADIVFSESSSLGVRFRYSQRRILKRSFEEIDSPWGKMEVKKIQRSDGASYFTAEFEVCRIIAEKYNIPLKDIYSWIMSVNKYY
ncbi:MAG: nickel pincer cofactor biosynthesis protein LarC [Deltaproteobacteria bacterium]|nr:nickel pincer cofactor biosynthesis protein LarC [Deltaproteobacteria bacterium]